MRTITSLSMIAALAMSLAQKLPVWQLPRRWWLTDALAPNERGKISRAQWRAAFSLHAREE